MLDSDSTTLPTDCTAFRCPAAIDCIVCMLAHRDASDDCSHRTPCNRWLLPVYAARRITDGLAAPLSDGLFRNKDPYLLAGGWARLGRWPSLAWARGLGDGRVAAGMSNQHGRAAGWCGYRTSAAAGGIHGSHGEPAYCRGVGPCQGRGDGAVAHRRRRNLETPVSVSAPIVGNRAGIELTAAATC